MSHDNENEGKLELQKVLAASLAYTQKEFRRAKRELIEEFKEVLDPEAGQSIKILEIKGARGPKGERGERWNLPHPIGGNKLRMHGKTLATSK